MPHMRSTVLACACVVALAIGCNVDTTTGGADGGGGGGGQADTGVPGEDAGVIDAGGGTPDGGQGVDAGRACWLETGTPVFGCVASSSPDVMRGQPCGSEGEHCQLNKCPGDPYYVVDCTCTDCYWDCLATDCSMTDGGTGDDAGFQKCTWFTDCEGTPPIKCMGAHWECVDGVCTGVCGDPVCPVERGGCGPGTFPGPGGVCLKTCDADAPDCPADSHCDYYHRLSGCPALCMPLCHPLDGCDLDCPFGHAYGPDGCIVCECGGPSTCPPACGIACEYGHRFGVDGCPLCECNDPPACPPLACMIDCPDGYQVDPRGCDICACVEKRPTCGGFVGKPCPLGQVCIGRMNGVPDGPGDCFPGCDDPAAVCPRGTICKPLDAGPGAPRACLPECDGPVCSLLCAWGYQRDGLGCEVCRCAQKPGCPDNDCDIFCPWGFALDVNGCQVCACAVKPGCTTLEVCSAICDNGWAVGPDGCPTCACNDHACGEPCNINCVCAQDRFGCEIPECQPWSFCGGFGGQQCPPGDVCVQAQIPDGNGTCVAGCDEKTNPCREGACVPSAFGEFEVQMGCAPKCDSGGCAVFCPGGYAKAYDGCDQCTCHVCPQPKCLPGCEFGRKADRFGCPGCECLEQPVACRAGFPQCADGTIAGVSTVLRS